MAEANALKRIRAWLLAGAALLVVGLLSSLVGASAANGEAQDLAYLRWAITLAGFVFAAGGWVVSVRGWGKKAEANRVTLMGGDGCSGLVKAVHGLQSSEGNWVSRSEMMSMQQAQLDRWESRCSEHMRNSREDTERTRREMNEHWEQQSKVVDSALAAMQTLTRTVGQALPNR